MNTNQNAELMLEIFRAIGSRDAQRVFSLCHPDVEFHWPPSVPYAGRGRGAWAETWVPLQPTRSRWIHGSWRLPTGNWSSCGNSGVSARG